MKSLRVYIPTRGRVGWMNQVTLRGFLEKSDEKPILICPPDEVADHKKYYKRVLACSKEGIGATRQWIIKNSSASIVIMADDDLRFTYRPDIYSGHMETCEELNTLVGLIRQTIDDGFIHGGLSHRQGNNFMLPQKHKRLTVDRGHLFYDNYRAMNFLFVNRREVLKKRATFIKEKDTAGKYGVMEDFFFTLSLITKGYPNRVIWDICWNQPASDSPGGCSLYRTAEIQSKSARALKEAFPDFVSLKIKKSVDTSPFWKNFKERVDVLVYWQRAYKRAMNKQTPIGFKDAIKTVQRSSSSRKNRSSKK